MRVCANLSYLGVELDQERNNMRLAGLKEINTKTSYVKILIVPTDEELEIANQCYEHLVK